jgi:hypothetical protein
VIITTVALVSCKEDQIQNSNSNSTITDDRKGPDVPSNLEVPAGNHLIYHVYASGVQVYRCTAGPNNTFVWTFVGPTANLYADAGFNGLVGIHYAGPRWESNSGSIVRGAVDQSAPSPDPNAIPWLLLHAVESSGPGIFNGVTYIQRVNTTGGKAPTTGCGPSEVGTEVSIPYTAEYYFYRAQN